MSPGRWLWPLLGTPAAEEPASRRTRDSGAELTAKEWAPYFASLDLSIAMMQVGKQAFAGENVVLGQVA